MILGKWFAFKKLEGGNGTNQKQPEEAIVFNKWYWEHRLFGGRKSLLCVKLNSRWVKI